MIRDGWGGADAGIRRAWRIGEVDDDDAVDNVEYLVRRGLWEISKEGIG